MKYCFGVDVGGTTVKLGLFTVEGELLDKWEIKTYTENEGERILPDVAEAIKGKIAEKLLKAEEICGIGVGVPAPVDKNGAIERAANVGWMAKEIKKELEELTGFPCVIGNDANVAALGEMWKGAGEGADAVDYKLISICQKGDIVVSQDYGVAAMALGKGAYVIHQSGKWYTNDNIDQMLMERHLNKKARRSSHKNHLKGPRKRTEEDDVRFAQSFERLILR